MCLWDFAAKTEKAYGGHKANSADLDEMEIEGCESEVVSPQQEQKTSTKYNFLPSHGEFGRQHLWLRKQDVIPVT